MRLGRKAQSLAEFVMIIGLVAGAFLAMRVYIQRALQARYHDLVQYSFRYIREQTGKNDIPSQFGAYVTSAAKETSNKGDKVTGDTLGRTSGPNVSTVSSEGTTIDEVTQSSGIQVQSDKDLDDAQLNVILGE